MACSIAELAAGRLFWSVRMMKWRPVPWDVLKTHGFIHACQHSWRSEHIIWFRSEKLSGGQINKVEIRIIKLRSEK